MADSVVCRLGDDPYASILVENSLMLPMPCQPLSSRIRPVHVLAIVACALVVTSIHGDGLGGAEVNTQAIPDAMQGTHPIQMPGLEGEARQLLLLSDRWVIVVTSSMDSLYGEIDRRTDGEFDRVVKTWMAGKAAGKPDWAAYHRRWAIVDEHQGPARLTLGERRLQEPATFTISSKTDSRYSEPRHPEKVDSLLVSLGLDRRYGESFRIDYAHYNYIGLPEPMKPGQRYTIAVDDPGKSSVAFVYDENTLVSRAIKINQAGYLPSASRKLAYIGAHLYEHGPLNVDHAETFEVVDVATGEVAYTGEVELLARNPRFGATGDQPDADARPHKYGEDVYGLDFSGLEKQGVFFIRVPGVGRSWPFAHREDVFSEVFYTAARGLYHQRAGVAVEEQYTPWTRRAALVNPVYQSAHIEFPPHGGGIKGYQIFDVIGGSFNRSVEPVEVIGGWHDAADWDRKQSHFIIPFDLLHAYEFEPAKFADGQLNIPESGNGVPDILDEVRFGLEMWRKSMDDRGGVAPMIETWTHPSIDDETVNYAFSQRTRWASLIFAAAAAQYAQHVKPFDAKDAELYAAAAKKAFAFGTDPANSLGRINIPAKKNRGKGEAYSYVWEEKDEYITPYLLHAKLRLHQLTGDASYLVDVERLAADVKTIYDWRYDRSDWAIWILYSIVGSADALPAEFVNAWRTYLVDIAAARVKMIDDNPYRATWLANQDFWMAWGASHTTKFNRSMAIAYAITGDEQYRDAMIANAEFMLGANPMGMSWLTGTGYVYPVDLQHAMSENDGIVDPVPGIMVYGVTGGPIWHEFREKVWVAGDGDGGEVTFVEDAHREPPVWRRWMVHPHTNVPQNEFTVHETMSPMIFTAAMLMGDDWRPARELSERHPRDEAFLFGRFYLP